MHPSSEPQLSTLTRHVRGGGQSRNGEPAPVIPRRVAVETERNLAPDDGPAVGVGTTTKRGSEAEGPRRTTGGLFVLGAPRPTARHRLVDHRQRHHRAHTDLATAGLIGSTGWGLWVAALGVTLLLRRIPSHVDTEDNRDPLPETPTTTWPATADPRS